MTLGGDAPRFFTLAARPGSLEKEEPLPPPPDGDLAPSSRRVFEGGFSWH